MERTIISTVKRNLLKNFQDFCVQNGYEPTNENMVMFLMSHNYIGPKTVKRAFVIEAVRDEALVRSKTKKLDEIEAEFKIPVRTSWEILRQFYNYFTFNKLYKELFTFK